VRVVLDTNIVVSALIWGRTPKRLLRAAAVVVVLSLRCLGTSLPTKKDTIRGLKSRVRAKKLHEPGSAFSRSSRWRVFSKHPSSIAARSSFLVFAAMAGLATVVNI